MTDDPTARLVRAFTRIAAERMAGLPLCNPALAVAAVDFAEHEGEWLGGLVTPWSLALVILPGRGGRFRPLRVGEGQEWLFPSGRYEFLGETEEGLGPYQTCSLYSPAFEFADQAAAVEVVRAARAALLQPADGGADAAARVEAARLAGVAPARAPLSRRGFLRGAFFGGGA